MNNKKKLGQFYTTNFEYILNGLVIPAQFNDIIEPFVGQGDLLNWIGTNKTVECYDLDPKVEAITQNTLLKPPEYNNKFVITNPPYLAKNKNKDKTIYNLYEVDDLYKAAIKSFINGGVSGGILIVPLNFLCDEDSKIRDLFFSNYRIVSLNIFEQKVFDDTDYTVCSFQFERGQQEKAIDTHIFPSNVKTEIKITSRYGWRIGGEIYDIKNKKYKFGRLVKDSSSKLRITNMFLQAIDTGSEDGRIKLVPDHEPYHGINTDRAFATITTDAANLDESKICSLFNSKLESYRKQYNSLFLTNYRNSSKSYARKRISFDLVYSMLSNIVYEIENN